jgi:hypothetical protein
VHVYLDRLLSSQERQNKLAICIRSKLILGTRFGMAETGECNAMRKETVDHRAKAVAVSFTLRKRRHDYV